MPRSDFAELVTAKDVVWLRVFAGVEGTEKECLWLVFAGIILYQEKDALSVGWLMWWWSLGQRQAHQSPRVRRHGV